METLFPEIFSNLLRYLSLRDMEQLARINTVVLQKVIYNSFYHQKIQYMLHQIEKQIQYYEKRGMECENIQLKFKKWTSYYQDYYVSKKTHFMESRMKNGYVELRFFFPLQLVYVCANEPREI